MSRKKHFPVPHGHWENLRMEHEWVDSTTAHLRLCLCSGKKQWTVFFRGEIRVSDSEMPVCCDMASVGFEKPKPSAKQCKRCLATLKKIKQSHAWGSDTAVKRCLAKAEKLKPQDPIGAWVIAHMPAYCEEEALKYAKRVTSLAPPKVPSPLRPEDVPRLGRIPVLDLIQWGDL